MGTKNGLGLVLGLTLSSAVMAGPWTWFFGKDEPKDPGPTLESPTPAVVLPANVALDEEGRKAKSIVDAYNAATLLKKEVLTVRSLAEVEALLRELRQEHVVLGERALFEEIFEDKLIPSAFLRGKVVITIVAPTKTGKSTIFAHLVRKIISVIGHKSGLTKHPVIAVKSRGGDESETVRIIFKYPKIRLIADASEAAQPHGDERVAFFYPLDSMPDNIVAIDAPDFDSDKRDNWKEAEKAARIADVIIAIITPDKHGDKAIQDFYKRMAEQTQKPVILVINKIPQYDFNHEVVGDLRDEFVRTTGVKPFMTLVVKQSESARRAPHLDDGLEFFEIDELKKEVPQSIRLLDAVARHDVNRLRLDALKGELNHGLTGPGGMNDWIKATQKLSDQYRALERALSRKVEETDSDYEELKDLLFSLEWPKVPPELFEQAYHAWWKDKQHAPNRVGAWFGGNVSWLFGKAAEMVGLTKADPTADFKAAEAKAVADTVSKLITILTTAQEKFPRILSKKSKALLNQNHIEIANGAVKFFQEGNSNRTQFVDLLKSRFPDWEKEHAGKMWLLHTGDYMRNTVLQLGGAMIATPLFALWTAASAAGLGATAVQILSNPIGKAASIGISAAVNSKVLDKSADAAGSLFWQRIFADLQTEYGTGNVALIFSYLFLQNEAPLKGVWDEIIAGKALIEKSHFEQAKGCVAKLMEQ